MALLVLAIIFLVSPQERPDQQFQQAGVCARCHVISVVEWGMSRHLKAGTGCVECHGASQGHVIDERNNIKPERMPRGAALAGLCAGCHKSGCPNSRQTASCQNCHHVHALVNPTKPPAVRDQRLEQRAAQWERFSRQMAEGERLAGLEQWDKAQAAFRAALEQVPGDRRAAERLRMCERRLHPGLPGFEIVGQEFDGRTGLPREVQVAGTGIAMRLAPGGEFEMGAERFPGSKPVHTVRLEPFYLGKFELTQAQWKSLMGDNPSAHQGDRLPVERVSWEDARAFVKKLNEKVPGGGFRLPTEAEWEFAARTGGALPQPNQPAPRPVGSGQPDKLGLFDMLGNVWEWCSSLSRPYPFDPADGREAPAATGLRILRGGGFADMTDLLDPALRHAERPNRRLRWNGLRLARSVPGVK
jgi:formylglycine-generating enzyme required for sulfatase activity